MTWSSQRPQESGAGEWKGGCQPPSAGKVLDGGCREPLFSSVPREAGPEALGPLLRSPRPPSTPMQPAIMGRQEAAGPGLRGHRSRGWAWGVPRGKGTSRVAALASPGVRGALLNVQAFGITLLPASGGETGLGAFQPRHWAQTDPCRLCLGPTSPSLGTWVPPGHALALPSVAGHPRAHLLSLAIGSLGSHFQPPPATQHPLL